ncbi:hypothetical protein [Bradyrhizobium sp. Gha]|uniref:hypothetical protein n=1 Tax=Bradyrhizobium sp. Gha TaxID=1855318 RepID=UPI0008E129D8|nr:hypothetical protein [Bradyrhizobium sp. Gha]SFI32521.1 hypothetical protein SAMN05216525_107118 [Bradyrhizobium sp. Gha]
MSKSISNLLEFFRAIWSEWFSRMSGPLSVPAAIAALWIENTTGKVLLAITAFVCIWAASYSVWRRERDRVSSLEAAAKAGPTVVRDVGLGEAVGYICFRRWGESFVAAASSSNVSGSREYDELLQAAADGEIPIWGKKAAHGVHEPIPGEFWFKHRMDWFSLLRGSPETESSVRSGSDETYLELMTSRAAIERYWPPLGSAGPRAISSLMITFGASDGYLGFEANGLHQLRRQLNLKLENIGPKGLTNCKVILESSEVASGLKFPIILRANVTLAPGDHVFIPLVEYGEARDKASYDCSDSFATLAIPEPHPLFDVGESTQLKLRATGLDTLPYVAHCRVLVDSGGRLQVQREWPPKWVDCPTPSGSCTSHSVE